jgi:predicted DNA-binding protein (MmcQ/YjbR family)
MTENPRENLTKSEAILRDFALKYPETHEDFPWGHRAFKVKGKVFVFMGTEEGTTGMSLKLPKSGKSALKFPYASPTAYGMGKHGWVSVVFDSGDKLPMELLLAWIDESYRAVAPKRVLALLGTGNVKSKPAIKGAAKRPIKKRRLAK